MVPRGTPRSAKAGARGMVLSSLACPPRGDHATIRPWAVGGARLRPSICMTVALLTVAGCSDEAPDPAIDFPDATAVARVPDMRDTPNDVGDPNVATDDSDLVEPADVSRRAEDNPLCQQYCAKLIDCNHRGGTNPEACRDECALNLAKDADGWSNACRRLIRPPPLSRGPSAPRFARSPRPPVAAPYR